MQIKRIHEYKRQLLNIIETVALYQAMKDEPGKDWVPRVKIFAGKAAASYRYAKLIIKLINDVAEVVNNDPAINGRLKVVFLPDYNVSLAEVIIPAADLSEQISTAGMEASGTGNMKLALNGALTIGTLDGANIEIRDHVGAENIAIFGMEAGDVMIRRKQGLDASDVIRKSPQLARAINAIGSGEFSPDEPSRFESIAHALRYLDHYMVSADFDSYYRGAAQRRRALAGGAGLDAGEHPQRRAHGLVLFRPHHPRICRRDLERPGAPRAGCEPGTRRARGAGLSRNPLPLASLKLA